MGSFLGSIQLWMWGVCLVVLFGIVTWLVMLLLTSRDQGPAHRDAEEESKLRERLSQIAEPPAVEDKRSA